MACQILRTDELQRQLISTSSGNDCIDMEPIIPSCDAVLDDWKNSVRAGNAMLSGSTIPGILKQGKEEAWEAFKFEIVHVIHTLRLEGWLRLPLERSSQIDIRHLSGALTNAVYVISPPKDLLSKASKDNSNIPLAPTDYPPCVSSHCMTLSAHHVNRLYSNLILRIYGRQIEHLLDREAELEILRRLARKSIGPRLLGTFTNGRFEEFLHAQSLRPEDLRVPKTSDRIAKCMRELHDCVELLPYEREGGPSVWRIWDKCVERCEQVISCLDTQVLENEQRAIIQKEDDWKGTGFVCGVQWPIFKDSVNKYRKWLEVQYGGMEKIKERLVLAHNDVSDQHRYEDR